MDQQQNAFQRSFNVQFGREQRGPGFGFWVGIILVLVGIGLLLDAFDMVEFSDLLGMWWPTILMFVAVAQLVTKSGSITSSGILFTVGALLQLSKLGYLPGGFWGAFWPILLILIGISFISSRWKKKTIAVDPNSIGRFSVDGSRVDRTAIFSGADVRVTSSDFTGGELVSVFGGVECDLRDAKILGKVASLKAIAIFGGVEVRVPSTWNVVVKGTPIMGGINDKAMPGPKDPEAPTLFIDATAIFGGIEIRP